ncbi:MAG: acyl-CoA dehydrogenase [Euryarchaeota archaeon]|nr:acyl-CoA dehydrogenase [Euryarchaeota archaeon]|tara:strand:+ start:77571 stop:78740 length:1170 start_codon:yes stop_codon:yes gene_type:complete
MDYAETEEQQMIRELVRDFAETVLAETVGHRDQNQQPPSEEWQQFLELGLQGVTIPEEFGGSPVDDISESIIVEELARVDPSFAVMYCVHVGLCAKTIALHGNQDQKERYLTRLAAGDVGAYSLSEAGAGTDAAAMTCKAKISSDGTHYILNGEKMWVTNGVQAKVLVLFAKDVDHPDYGVKKHGGSTAFIVESDFEGFSVGKKEDKLGIRSSDTCTLILENCKVPVENVLKGFGKGFPIAMNALDNSRIGIAAQALGIAQGAFEAALQYAHEREAFGKPIAFHQMIMAYLADMATRIEAARQLVYRASWVKQQHYEHGGPRHSKEASMAKLYAGDTAMWVSERAIQVLGGYGYTKEFPVERFFRDAKITQIYEGTQEVQRIVIARALK